MGSHHGGVEHLNKMRRLGHCRERIKEGLECPGSAQSPEPFPHTVPMPKLGRKRTPSDVVNQEIMQGFEKSPIILSVVLVVSATPETLVTQSSSPVPP